jgi:hypothetical protein
MTPDFGPAQLARVLRGAARLLEDHGWTTGYFRSPEGCYCIVGAIQATAGDDIEAVTAAAAVSAWLTGHGEDISLTRWNDERCHSGVKAARLLRTVAGRLASVAAGDRGACDATA